MSANSGRHRVLDLRGLPNPESILGLMAAAEALTSGVTVYVVSDDFCFANDCLRWCAGGPLTLVSLRHPTNGITEIVLHKAERRVGRSSAPDAYSSGLG